LSRFDRDLPKPPKQRLPPLTMAIEIAISAVARPVRAFGVEETMTGTTRSSDGLDIRRRKLLFRAWHRGTREMDLIMGRFADNTVGDLSESELGDFERLIDVPDRELLAWVTGEEIVPANHDTPLFRRLHDFHFSGEGLR